MVFSKNIFRLSFCLLLFIIFTSLSYSDEMIKNIYIINSQSQISEDNAPMVNEQVAILNLDYTNPQFYIYYLDNDRSQDKTYQLVHEKLAFEVTLAKPDIVIVNGYDA